MNEDEPVPTLTPHLSPPEPPIDLVSPEQMGTNLIDFLRNEVKKWNGWACVSVSPYNSGDTLRKKILGELTTQLGISSDALEQPEEANSDSECNNNPRRVVVRVHKEIPALSKEGLYESITQRHIGLVEISDPAFKGMICDRQLTCMVGDPYAITWTTSEEPKGD